MADVDVEPEKIIAEETKEPKSVNIDAMGADDLVNKEIELTRNKSKYGRYAYNEAKELAAIQRRLYGSPKVNMPKKPQTPFEYNKNMERYAPIMPRQRTYNMEVRGKTQLEVAKRFDRNKKPQHRRRRKKKNKSKDKDEEDKKR